MFQTHQFSWLKLLMLSLREGDLDSYFGSKIVAQSLTRNPSSTIMVLTQCGGSSLLSLLS